MLNADNYVSCYVSDDVYYADNYVSYKYFKKSITQEVSQHSP